MDYRVKLKAEHIHLSFGKLRALEDVSLEVVEGEIFALIGPNGAGKTSFLNCINGFYRANQGTISFDGQEVTKLPPYKIAQLGISRVFQNIELYTGMSVLDNLMAARHVLMKRGALAGAIYFGFAHDEEIEHRKEVERIIDFLEIQPIRKKVVGALPYGMRKRVELGRALALEPKLLLLDEPLAGMNLEEKEDIARFILDIREEWCSTIFMVEHDMGVVMDISDSVAVLDFGHKIAQGTPEEISCNEEVIKAYLGTKAKV